MKGYLDMQGFFFIIIISDVAQKCACKFTKGGDE